MSELADFGQIVHARLSNEAARAAASFKGRSAHSRDSSGFPRAKTDPFDGRSILPQLPDAQALAVRQKAMILTGGRVAMERLVRASGREVSVVNV